MGSLQTSVAYIQSYSMYAKVYCTSFNNFVLVKFVILNLLLLLVLVGSVAGPYFIATKDTFDFLFF